MDLLQVIGEPRRREILRLVWNGELSSGEIARHFDVTFGAVSQHLNVLRQAGAVQVRAAGNQRLYHADRARLGPLAAVLEAMWAETLDQLVEAIEAESGPR